MVGYQRRYGDASACDLSADAGIDSDMGSDDNVEEAETTSDQAEEVSTEEAEAPATEVDIEEVKEAITHDKKASNSKCSVVFVPEIGNGEIEEWSMERVLGRLENESDEECIW